MANNQSSTRQQPPRAAYAYDRQTALSPHTPLPSNRISASTLLSQFKARPSPSSVSQMTRSGTSRHSQSVANIDLTDGDDMPLVSATLQDIARPASPEVIDVEAFTALRSDDSVLSNINVADPHHVIDLTEPASRASTTRSTRAKVDYSTPKRVLAPKTNSKKKLQSQRILESDAMDASPKVKSSKKAQKAVIVKADTARNRVRDDIATITKAKRDAFLLHHQEHFLPLLPESNYITKLSKSRQQMQDIVPHSQLDHQPEKVTATMKPYQLKGLSFLATMYKNGMSAILGDEMGLGKTLQTLSLIQYLEESHPCPPGISRPYLVVCPLSVLESWYNECRKWTPQLRPMRFHGNASERDHLKQRAAGRVDRFGNETNQPKRKRNRKGGNNSPGKVINEEASAGFDILITTYEVFVAEASWFKQAFVWRYIVLDEGHKIKNEKTAVSHALQGLKAEHRLLLTGTPLQNNLREMWALLHWLFPDVFTEKTADVFANAFDLSKGVVSTNFMDDARRLLELVMLRRLKSSPGVNLGLPPKHEVLLYVPLTPVQRFWYTRLLTKAGGTLIDDLFSGMKQKEQKALSMEQPYDEEDSQLEKAVAAADEGADQWAESRQIIEQAIENDTAGGEKDTSAYKRLLNLVMQLRKCCVHPYLIKGAAPDPYFLGPHIINASGKFIALGKLVDELIIKQKKKILIFSGFTSTLDYCEDLLFHKGANTHNYPFRFLRLDGESARAKRNLDIRLFNDQSSEFKIMLISTKAGGLGLNLTAASEIIFLDEDWNPQVTLQAEARAHRIGQTKPVTIYKICTQGTVEEQMMGRIRKKLYLSAKITESMRDIHSAPEATRKRKRPDSKLVNPADESVPQLGMGQLMSLVRRGASTLAHPAIDVNEMLSWDFDTLIDKCKDHPTDPHIAEKSGGSEESNLTEKEWLAKMERVECAVLDGVKYQREKDKGAIAAAELTRSDRRIGKNTTVMVDGFAINKESLLCADWEAVPTMAGKDPRLATPKKEKAPPIQHQDYCQVCHDGGEVVLCAGCPRIYHLDCLSDQYKIKSERSTGFHCSQHQCFDCEKNTSDAGGLIYRCRWCEKGFCEDCLDWDSAKLLGGTLPEYDMLEYASRNAWYVECHNCTLAQSTEASVKDYFVKQRSRIKTEHDVYLQEQADAEEAAAQAVQDHKSAVAGTQIQDEDIAKATIKDDDHQPIDETMTDATTLSSSGAVTPRDLVSTSTQSQKRRARTRGNLSPHPQARSDPISPSSDAHPATNGGYLRRRRQVDDYSDGVEGNHSVSGDSDSTVQPTPKREKLSRVGRMLRRA